MRVLASYRKCVSDVSVVSVDEVEVSGETDYDEKTSFLPGVHLLLSVKDTCNYSEGECG